MTFFYLKDIIDSFGTLLEFILKHFRTLFDKKKKKSPEWA